MYYDDLLEIIDNELKILDGCEVKDLFIEKFGSGSVINMNKALKKLRHDDKVCSHQEGRRIYYWSIKIKKAVNIKKFMKSRKN